MAGNIKGSDVIPSKDRVGGLDRSDEELQRGSESGVGATAQDKRASDDVDPNTGVARGRGGEDDAGEAKGRGTAEDTSDRGANAGPIGEKAPPRGPRQ